jgi:hypothetical protein
MKTMNRARELTELFSISKMGVIHHAIQGLRTKYSREFDASKLFKQLDQMAPAKAHWTFTPAVMILISLAVFLTGTLIWKKCLRTPGSHFISSTDANAYHQPETHQQGKQFECLNPNCYRHFIK